ncbi:SDR family NAD(P)-dependent oxidoreductase [Oceanimonas sp. MB9]|uniref:SDR family NAD(P)-dependent oxidoreductase n=1 Tax=Oceanimonas sp. MB9 TaxID=2588453 RepID=UPI0013F5E3C2|nr:glucose 1-dehydrogenase [Oceanimonas sp. MB9]NHI02116.1 2-dehydro-3-deoxy-D-gluconate 5-dehydrogenase [Oceanimonas sp. MB9]
MSVPATPSFSLVGKIALITGASKGIGRAAALALANQGAHVVCVGRGREALDVLCEEIRQLGQSAEALEADMSSMRDIVDKIGGVPRIDILVNNAGTNIPEAFVDVTEAHFDQLVQLNIKGYFFVAQQVAAKMQAHGAGGSIINMSSQMGHVGAAQRTVYCMTKHAVEGLTKAMAVELAPHAIRVNSLCPTFIKTPMTEPFFASRAFQEDTLTKIPLGRVGTVEDIMGAVIYLASDASALVTGSSLKVDGGWTAQ